MIVKSKRSNLEKKPWKDLADLDGVIESEFIRPLYSGQTIVPFRTLAPDIAVIPWADGQLLSEDQDQLERFTGLSKWWKEADEIWNDNRSSKRLTLQQRINYRNGLKLQFPLQPRRIVYATSGMHICAAQVVNRRAVIDNKLYWATINHEDEGHYLTAILNAEVTTLKTRPLMSYGKDERDIHKHVWKLNIPEFDPNSSLHQEIAALGKSIEEMVSQLTLRDVYFATIRKDVRAVVRATDEGQEVEKLVDKLIV